MRAVGARSQYAAPTGLHGARPGDATVASQSKVSPLRHPFQQALSSLGAAPSLSAARSCVPRLRPMPAGICDTAPGPAAQVSVCRGAGGRACHTQERGQRLCRHRVASVAQGRRCCQKTNAT